MTTTRAAATGSVHSIDQFALAVPSVAETADFFRHFGLQVDALDGKTYLRTVGGRIWGQLLPSAGDTHLSYLSFGIHQDDEPVFRARIAVLGIACDPPAHADPGGLWFWTPDRQRWQLVVADKCSPSQASVADPVPARQPGHRGAPARGAVEPVQPRYLSHVMLLSPDVLRMLAFAQDFLGLRLSDHVDGGVAFTHTPHGSDHHLLAFAHAAHPGFHHTSWDVPSVDAVGRGAQQMRKAGYSRGWGLGRHVLGSNFFHYVRMPAGGFAEYSFGIDFIGAGEHWPSANHPAEDSYYIWGPEHPDDMLENPTAAPADDTPAAPNPSAP